MKWNAAVANDAIAWHPDRAATPDAKAKQPRGESKTRPIGSCNMKGSVLTKSLRLRAKRGKLLVIGNLFVLPPNTLSPYTPHEG